MPSRPVLIGRGLVTHTPTNNHHASTIQNLNQQTQPPTQHRGDHQGRQPHNGSQRYGGHSGRETPGTIPNPEVKPASANGTAPDRMWESRTPPNNNPPDGGHHTMAPIASVGRVLRARPEQVPEE